MIRIFILTISSWRFSQRTQYILLGSSIFLILINLPFATFFSTWVFHDFLSYILIFLTAYILILIKLITNVSSVLTFLLVILSADLFLAFTVDNLILFYLLFEFSLVPMSLIILGWGFQPERLRATLYILFYTITSSFPFLAFIIYSGVPFFSDFVCVNKIRELWVTFFVLLPFLVKLPVFIVHLWLPKAHVEAPAFGSMVLAAILLKLGSFGIWRLFPLFSRRALIVAVFSLMGGGLCRLLINIQTDVKSIIAYSSVVHIGLISFSLLFGNALAALASLIIIIAHGVCSSGLFCLITLAYERFTTRRVVIAQGLLSVTPVLCLFFALLLLINLRAPPSLSLLSETNIIYSALSWNFLTIMWISLLILFSLIYSLVLFYSYFHGQPTPLFALASDSKKEIRLSFFHRKWWLLSPFIFYLFEL